MKHARQEYRECCLHTLATRGAVRSHAELIMINAQFALISCNVYDTIGSN